VSVECNELIPDRLVMPTVAPRSGMPPFGLLRVVLAEIDRRESYEVQLLAAQVAHTKPNFCDIPNRRSRCFARAFVRPHSPEQSARLPSLDRPKSSIYGEPNSGM